MDPVDDLLKSGAGALIYELLYEGLESTVWERDIGNGSDLGRRNMLEKMLEREGVGNTEEIIKEGA